jgi:hypothetical protein
MPVVGSAQPKSLQGHLGGFRMFCPLSPMFPSMRSRSHREGSRTQLADPAPMAATGAAADVDVRLAPDDVGRLWGIRTSVVVGQASTLVTGLQPRDCKSIAKASTVRIPRLPPRAKRAPDAETRFGGPLRIPSGGIVTALLGDRQGRGSQASFRDDLRKRIPQGHRGGVPLVREVDELLELLLGRRLLVSQRSARSCRSSWPLSGQGAQRAPVDLGADGRPRWCQPMDRSGS